MKILRRKSFILLAIINMITLSVFLYSYSEYRIRKKIVDSGINIEKYKILEYRCWGGTRGGSVVEIMYNSKKYRVGLSYPSCDALKENKKNIEFYYDENSDKIFTSSGLTVRMVTFFGMLFIFFISFWFIPKRYW